MLYDVVVIVVAILFATYRLSRLESERGRRGANIAQDVRLAIVDSIGYRMSSHTTGCHSLTTL